ncbi:hypothetical protein I3843_01G129200, partial [Carya illinoinensis]
AIHIAIAVIFVFSISFLHHVNGLDAQTVIDSPLLTQKIGINRTIKVDINGNGDFKSVQAANSQWVIIHIRKGVYRVKVHVPKSKPYIFLRGNGKGRSAIVWAQSSSDNVESATFKVEAPHFIAFGISFKNEAPTGVAYTSQNQSVAAFVAANKLAFYHCAFYSTHSTLFDYKGRHYYDNCYIQGSIDFIFGRGRSVFHSCEIFVIADKRVMIHGSVTAQNREVKARIVGCVCQRKGSWCWWCVFGESDRCLFQSNFCKDIPLKDIVPHGWTNWSYDGNTENLYHAAYKCHGLGADSEQRSSWSKQLSDEVVTPFLSIDYIDGEKWLPVWL